jgi:hypothetical protein
MTSERFRKMHAPQPYFGTLTLQRSGPTCRQPLFDANTALPLRKLHL